MSTVQVAAHPTTGKIITPSTNNPEWGTVRVSSEELTFSNGIVNNNTRSAFVRGEIKNLSKMFTREGQNIPGKIIRKTSYSPFFTGQKPVMNPTTGEVVLKNGKEFFQEYEFTQDLQAVDHEVVVETPVAKTANVGTADPIGA